MCVLLASQSGLSKNAMFVFLNVSDGRRQSVLRPERLGHRCPAARAAYFRHTHFRYVDVNIYTMRE